MNNRYSIIICPGIHDLKLTQTFLEGLRHFENSNLITEQVLVFPAQDYPAYSAIHILEFLKGKITNIKSPIAFISFSAGVVGAMGAAGAWQLLGGNVKTLIAIDGWGVPLFGNFPIHRLSHDYFTHWSSAFFGAGEDSFYADPAVEHLDLWKSPNTCNGWWMPSNIIGEPERRIYTTATEFMINLLQNYLA